MLDHVSIQVSDVAASRTFYEQLLAPLGVSVTMDFGEVLGFGTPAFPFFWLGPPEDPSSAVGRGIHLAFTAPDRATVRAVHEAAVAAGIEVLHEPRVFPEYHPNYYGVFVRDLDGHNIEAVCHQPES
jgi:catechol 2,3-dioxygenase-like lactoylglutathione lyase family enzyme